MRNQTARRWRPWRFAIDVGGTFTDCIGHSPDGNTFRHKILSSGVTQGTTGKGSGTSLILDPCRCGDPEGFWRGFQIRLFDKAGAVTNTCRVTSFAAETGRLELESSVQGLSPGQKYELFCDLPAPVVAIRYVLRAPIDQPLPPTDLRLGTTRGTNALLTRTGAPTALVTTQGFGDILLIRDQQRPRLFELDIRKSSSLFQQTLEVPQRVAHDGTILQPLDHRATRAGLLRLKNEGIRSLAVCLLHGYAYPDHERQIGNIANEVGFADISLSHQVAPMMKIVPRGDTTVVDAYLNPVLATYRYQVESALGEHSRTRWMTSAGGLVNGENFRGKESILSGPAGGVVGFSKTATAAGFPRSIGFDMGGTSTDVTRFDGTANDEPERVYETQKAGIHLSTPMLAIETVAAGGGSICGFDGMQIAVGPASAGADPGPACYGRGGPLTVTDMNLILGRIREDRFPFALDRMAVEEGLRRLCEQIDEATGRSYSLVELAEGMLHLATAKMAEAIRSISTAKGYDPRDYALASFGGAAPQHACAVARELGIRNIINHPDAGILSAVGIGLAPVIRHADQGIYRPWSSCHELLAEMMASLASQARDKILEQLKTTEIDGPSIQTTAQVDLRYLGQDAYLTLEFEPADSLQQRFHQTHRGRYGYAYPDRELEVVAAHVMASSAASSHESQDNRTIDKAATESPSKPTARTEAVFNGQMFSTAIFDRESLLVGQAITGPAIIAERLSTTVVEPDWLATVLPDGQILLTDKNSDAVENRSIDSNATSADAGKLDPIQLEVFNNAFAGIADQMGQTLRNTATSVNVKERLDFSCALFDSDGNLVVNAPHVPVHLGAMSETIRHLIADHSNMAAGDVFVTNDPYRGGSHLPDVTVITPVFDVSGEHRLFFTASRAHHAEIGGISPGSMPPFSKRLSEEGVLIPSQRVVDAGISRLDELRKLLSTASHPSRAVHDNIADIAAQIAANQQGATRLAELTQQHGSATIVSAMQQLLDVAEAKTRRALGRLGDRELSFEDQLDDHSPIQVKIKVHAGAAEIDFSGSADVHAENLNANRGIVQAATIYVLRCLIDEDLPINQGILRPVRLQIPNGILNPPDHGDPNQNAAMVGGNVETSQRIVDVLLGAFGLAAASQGTMNNLLFGNETFGYYETICGGAGATPDADGASAVHTHMTNTRLTDPEVFESRFPVRLREFRIRRDSGGNGKHRGGDGIVRQIEFLGPLTVSLITQRRTNQPYGLNGGSPGASGENILKRLNQTEEQLPSRIQLAIEPGDTLTLKTPGGGGYGSQET